MAQYVLDDKGANAAAATVSLPGNSANDPLTIVNDTSSAVTIVATWPSQLTLNTEKVEHNGSSGGNVVRELLVSGETIKMDKQSFLVLSASISGTLDRAISIAEGGIKTTHGAATQVGEKIYFSSTL